MCRIAYLDARTALADRLIAKFATAEDDEHGAKHRPPRRQRQTLAARALLRAVLALEQTAAAWRLLPNPEGYPRVAEAGTARRVVSLSHSGDIVACATTEDGAIGVDVERIRTERPVVALARAAFGPVEVVDVERGGAAAFYRIWTLREALAKASGDGFGLLVNRQDLVPAFTAAGRRRIGDAEWDLACWTLEEGYELGFARQTVAGGNPPILPPWNIADRITP